MADPGRALLRRLAAGDPVTRLVLACPDVAVPKVERGTLVVLGEACLAGTDVGLPAQLLASGVGQVAVLPCPDAERTTDAWQAVLRDVTSFAPPRRGRRPRDVLVLGQVPLPRRVVLGLRVDSVLDLDQDDAARTLAAFRILQDAGRAVLPPVAPAPEPARDEGASGAVEGRADTPPASAADLAVSGCVACGVCVRACPHDALALEHDGATSTLTHLRESCRSELECVALCPVDAISSGGSLPLAVVLETPAAALTSVATAACTRCGARHPAAEGDLCPPCRFRQGNAFGSSLPPGVAEKLSALRRRQESG